MPKDQIARTLIEAARTRTAVHPLTDDYPDLDPATAYEVQDAVVNARVEGGARIIGAKLGLTSVAKQKQMNVSEPLYGWLTDDMQLDTGQTLVCSDYIQPRCEPEIAFLLGEDLAGPQVLAAHVLAATELVFPAIDVLDSRFAGYKFTGSDVIADNSSCAGFVFGGQGTDPRGIDLRLVGCAFEKNGELVATAAGAAVLGHPAASVAWMIRRMAERGQGMKAGQIVMAGALTEAVAVAPGDTVVARFDRLGSVELPCR
ncbi:MAG: 4-oxalocrotonate decarboxylase [Actinomycetales bacterium]|nr:4-oxalocrotonate decarboxylase [Actinomycetales bacterium]